YSRRNIGVPDSKSPRAVIPCRRRSLHRRDVSSVTTALQLRNAPWRAVNGGGIPDVDETNGTSDRGCSDRGARRGGGRGARDARGVAARAGGGDDYDGGARVGRTGCGALDARRAEGRPGSGRRARAAGRVGLGGRARPRRTARPAGGAGTAR